MTDLQRADVGAQGEATREAQRQYQARIREEEARAAAVQRGIKQEAAKRRDHADTHSRVEPRLVAEVSDHNGGAYGGIGHWIGVSDDGTAILVATVEYADGEPLIAGTPYWCQILSGPHRGAHWSDRPHGRSGWYKVYQVALAPELQHATQLTAVS